MLINSDLMSLDLEGNTKEEVIRALALVANKAGRVKDVDGFVQAVLKREEEFTTGIGFGVAIPHGKTDAVREPFLAFGKTSPIDWASMDNTPVNMIFMIGVPEAEAGKEHLQILAKISRKLMKSEFRQELKDANTKEEVLKVLEEVQ